MAEILHILLFLYKQNNVGSLKNIVFFIRNFC